MSHDQNFKNLILDYPHAAVSFFAESEAGGIDEGVRILPIREEQLQERLGERFHELDVPLLSAAPQSTPLTMPLSAQAVGGPLRGATAILKVS